MIANYVKAGLICLCALGMSNNSIAQTSGTPIKNVVLVHGAWADGSGWKCVYDILVKDGYTVSMVQEPETSFKDDVAATKRVIAQQEGQCILVAYSYGGAVITEAGTDPSVVGLVYVAAHMPDVGENEADDGKRFPSDLSKSTAIKKTEDGFTYLDPAQFHELEVVSFNQPRGPRFEPPLAVYRSSSSHSGGRVIVRPVAGDAGRQPLLHRKVRRTDSDLI